MSFQNMWSANKCNILEVPPNDYTANFPALSAPAKPPHGTKNRQKLYSSQSNPSIRSLNNSDYPPRDLGYGSESRVRGRKTFQIPTSNSIGCAAANQNLNSYVAPPIGYQNMFPICPRENPNSCFNVFNGQPNSHFDFPDGPNYPSHPINPNAVLCTNSSPIYDVRNVVETKAMYYPEYSLNITDPNPILKLLQSSDGLNQLLNNSMLYNVIIRHMDQNSGFLPSSGNVSSQMGIDENVTNNYFKDVNCDPRTLSNQSIVMIGDLYVHNLKKIKEEIELIDGEEHMPTHYQTIDMHKIKQKSIVYYYMHSETVRIYFNSANTISGFPHNSMRLPRRATLLLKSYEIFPKFEGSGYEPTINISRHSSISKGSQSVCDSFVNNSMHVDMTEAETNNQHDCVVDLNLDEHCDISIDFKLSVDANYQLLDSDVDMNRVIVCAFEIIEENSPLAYSQTVFYTGLQIMGKFNTQEIEPGDGFSNALQMHDTTHTHAVANNSKSLSSEAVKFIPRDLTTYFDNKKVALFPFRLLDDMSSIETRLFHVPPAFKSILNRIENLFTPTQFLVDQYKEYYRNNNLLYMMNLCGLNSHYIFKLFDTMKKKRVEKNCNTENFMEELQEDRDPHAYMENLGQLMLLEEIHMQIDISKFDLHHQKIHFEPPNNAKILKTSKFGEKRNIEKSSITTMLCKLHILGSSESRPHILVGLKIRFRCANPGWRNLFGATCVDASGEFCDVFEMEGVVLSYRLATEIAICEVVVPTIYPFSLADTRLRAPFPNENVILMCNQMAFHCRFTFDRNSFVFMHTAIVKMLSGDGDSNGVRASNHYLSILFPIESQRVDASRWLLQTPLPQSKQHNGKICGMPTCSFNSEQLLAINRIIQLSQISENNKNATRDGNNAVLAVQLPPFVLFGPPGTGKTSTLIASIINICEHFPNARVLACAPSDAAADLIALRLISYFESKGHEKTGKQGTKNQLFRLNWWQRVKDSVPLRLQSYCHEVNNLYDIPTCESLSVQLGNCQVIVSTCGAVGSLLYSESLQMPECQFDVVVIDEASQALEPEVIIPVALCKPGGVVVIAGDVNQLGPVTRTPIIHYCGVRSLQSRLLQLPYYANCIPNAKIAANSDITLTCMGVFLYKNYRSQYHILTLSSKLFYNGALQQYGDSASINSMLGWKYHPACQNKAPHIDNTVTGFPLLYIDVNGTQHHDIDSPSFYNNQEIERVVEVCQQLLSPCNAPDDASAVSMQDIGVIAAFRQQVLRIRKALRSVGLSEINVGSVEDYQGQEYRVVLISTVLSIHPKERHYGNESKNNIYGAGSWNNKRIVKSDFDSAWGLLNDPRKFNVSISRAMAMCIVIGSSKVLLLDSLWREFIIYCNKHGSVLGQGKDVKQKVSGLYSIIESDHGYQYQYMDSYRWDNILNAERDADDTSWLDRIGEAFKQEVQSNTNETSNVSNIYKLNTDIAMNEQAVQSLNDLLCSSYMNDLEWRSML